MSLSISHIKKVLKRLDQLTFKEYGYLTPSIVSQKVDVPQNIAKIILELACKSDLCRKVYLIRSPYGDHSKTFGPYNFKSEIPKMMDPQSYDEDDFEVSPDLIEEVYKLQ